MEKAQKKEVKKTEKIEQPKVAKKVSLENRHNYPYELSIGKTFIRFEPRGKEGSIKKVDLKLLDHPEFLLCKKHFIIGVK
jgi:hypothetical protein